ncbi:MAG: hypothetical protein HUJ86_04055 [Synergistes sp.]|nr:hypothetical protein [Synergistes sp.]
MTAISVRKKFRCAAALTVALVAAYIFLLVIISGGLTYSALKDSKTIFMMKTVSGISSTVLVRRSTAPDILSSLIKVIDSPAFSVFTSAAVLPEFSLVLCGVEMRGIFIEAERFRPKTDIAARN